MKIIDKAWGGQDLPFPVLLDATGETMQRYRLERFPTILLIDPDGNLVGEGDEEDLAKKLGITPPTSL